MADSSGGIVGGLMLNLSDCGMLVKQPLCLPPLSVKTADFMSTPLDRWVFP
jgi:hypothetical protein